ncbi:hypothetical protein LR48_Vigan233s003200 [Vigna angularis]|uniref:Putative plant transposon protein domain-containing protein n=1 Tax=Phaseolus angularis TaxID=3914 RepID=A0A0L9T6E3_PHAAN|nr:hypothetical protein LR48_Vigan233s003200 [Vigna angularis]
MPHLADPYLMASMGRVVSQVAQAGTVLNQMGELPTHEEVDSVRARLTEIEANLSHELEEIAPRGDGDSRVAGPPGREGEGGPGAGGDGEANLEVGAAVGRDARGVREASEGRGERLGVGMIPNVAPQFGEQVLGNDWGKLATYPAPANIAVVKEFYTNAKKIGDYPTENYLGYVRGHAIRYDPDSINNFLDTVWAGEQCQFALCMEEGADFEDVERVLCIPGGHFQRNRSGSVVNIRRTDLNPLAKYWMAFSHANIQPCSHVSDITLSRALFIYCAIRNLNVNIGQVIADEISVCANTSNNKAPLGHPSLITHLCKLAGVDTSVPPFERPRKASDEAYYRQYCGGAQLQSIHRGQVATAEMIVGIYHTPPAHRWTMDEFHNVVAWPEEPVHGGGAGAAEASARDMEEDEAEEEDAFDDDEDEEEEEDTESSD